MQHKYTDRHMILQTGCGHVAASRLFKVQPVGEWPQVQQTVVPARSGRLAEGTHMDSKNGQELQAHKH